MERLGDLLVLAKIDLQEIFSDIFNKAPKWFNLGLALGLVSDELNKIKVAHRDNPDECLREMLTLWLSKRSPKPTREALICALRERTVGEDAFADELQQKYNSPSRSVTQLSHHNLSPIVVADTVVVEKQSCEVPIFDEKIESQHQPPELLQAVPVSYSSSIVTFPPTTQDASLVKSTSASDSDQTLDAVANEKPQKLVSHYNGMSFEFISPLPEDLICRTCQHLAFEPQQIKCCGKLYCQSCLGSSDWCAVCDGESESSLDVRSDKQIQDLAIKCPNSPDGCSWEGRLGDVSNHRSFCPKEVVSCIYKDIGCNEVLHRDEVKTHEEENWQIHLDYSLKKQILMMKRIEQLEEKCAKTKEDLIQRGFSDPPILTVTMKKVDRDSTLSGQGDHWISQAFFQHGYLLQIVLKSVVFHPHFNPNSKINTREYLFTLVGSNIQENVTWPCSGTCTFTLKHMSSELKIKFSFEKPMKALNKISPSDEKEFMWTQVADRKVTALLSENPDKFEVNIIRLYITSSSSVI